VPCAGILLTGGASSRFGQDKATTTWDHRTLAQRAAEALAAVTSPAIEVGPGVSGLPHVPDARQGPLVALAAGLAQLPPRSSVLLLACDLPLVGPDLLAWLVEHPSAGSVVPLSGDPPHAQPLCARWSASALECVPALVEMGERSLRPLLAQDDVTLVSDESWTIQGTLDDADTPADLDRLRSRHRHPLG
jgi:molybdopterin-guanine dinucleotide biosynthesis protein A